MILADTTIWVDHFRSPEPELLAHLETREILMHSMVIGELACGNLRTERRPCASSIHCPECPNLRMNPSCPS